jgi:hypothetical protein
MQAKGSSVVEGNIFLSEKLDGSQRFGQDNQAEDARATSFEL